MDAFSEAPQLPDALSQPVVQRLIAHLQAGRLNLACACASEIVDTGASYWLRDVRRALDDKHARLLDEVIRMMCDAPVDIIRSPHGALACLFPMALMFRLQFDRPVRLTRAHIPFDMTYGISSAPRTVLKVANSSTVFTEPRFYTKWAAHDTSLKAWRQHMRQLGSSPPSQTPLTLRPEMPGEGRHEPSVIHHVGILIYVSTTSEGTKDSKGPSWNAPAKDAEALARAIIDEIKLQPRFSRIDITPGGALVPASKIAQFAHASEQRDRLLHAFSEAATLNELGKVTYHARIKVDKQSRRFRVSLHPPHDRVSVASYGRKLHQMDEIQPTSEAFLGALRECGVTDVFYED